MFALRKNFFPPTPEGYEDSLAAFEKFGQFCLELTGEQVLSHMDTVSAVNDMGTVRAALGEKATFWGSSYRKQYMYTYAQLFPDNIRALLLDAILDHSYSVQLVEYEAVLGSALTLQRFINWPENNSTSPLHSYNLSTIYYEICAKAEEEPLPAPESAQTRACSPNVVEWEFRKNSVTRRKNPRSGR